MRTLWITDRHERRQKSLAIGVFADERVAAADDTVDGIDEPSAFAEAIEVLDHRHLVRHRQIKTLPAHGTGTGDGGGEAVGLDLSVDVSPVESQATESRLEHDDGGVVVAGG